MEIIKINNLRKILQAGDMVLIKTEHNLIAWLIQLFCEYSHVGMVSENMTLRHYVWPAAAEDSLYAILANKVIMVRRFHNITDSQINQMMWISAKDVKDRQPYDVRAYGGYTPITGIRKWLGIDLSWINNPYDNAGYVCSSGCNYWARYAGRIIDAAKGLEMITPEDIKKTREMSTIFKGRVKC